MVEYFYKMSTMGPLSISCSDFFLSSQRVKLYIAFCKVSLETYYPYCKMNFNSGWHYFIKVIIIAISKALAIEIYHKVVVARKKKAPHFQIINLSKV